MKPCARVVLTICALPVFLAVDDCPVTMNPASEQTPSSSSGAVDVGGSSGALWQVLFEEEVLVTVKQGQDAASKKVKISSGSVELLGGTVDVASFCWRTDVACPQQVLPTTAMGSQLASSNTSVLISYKRRGPLYELNQQGLAGVLQGKELPVPLTVGAAQSGICGLQTGSAVLGTAYATSGSGARADTLQGRSTVVYTGSCFNLGGSGALESDARIELSVGFAAKRQL